MAAEGSNNDATEAVVLETLRSRGWCFDALEKVNAIIFIQSALADDISVSSMVDSVEKELLNTDIRSIGGNSLPDSNLLRKSPYLNGPKILQISSVRDISLSSMEEASNTSSSRRRLLKFILTDGHTEITAIEYSPIPSIPDDVVPGTKVRLEHKAAVHNGIVCLNSKAITLLGGVVQLLYEEWQVQRKYSALAFSSLRPSQESDSGGPPPFEKLEIGAPLHQLPRQDHRAFNSKSSVPAAEKIRATNGQKNSDCQDNNADLGPKAASSTKIVEEKPNSLETRQKEVAEFAPVQNQAAAQKLLQKMNQQNQGDWKGKGRKHRGKGKQEETPVFTLEEWERRKAAGRGKQEPQILTLEEWERRKAGGHTVTRNEVVDTSRDEDLARQLQTQLDVEDSHAPSEKQEMGADDIRRSMFNYERGDSSACGWENGGRVRGRGRGMERGSRSGRGRGKNRGRGAY